MEEELMACVPGFNFKPKNEKPICRQFFVL